MDNLSVFDIVGPVMIGPSSSHTAGAVRIGNLAREIVGNKLKKIKVYLHGSFKETYKGHGTDKALIGGLLGLATDDSAIKNSFALAEEEGFSFEFSAADLDEVHPNTVKLEIIDQDDVTTTIVASSTGGGSIIVSELNGTQVKLRGEYYTLITFHEDRPGLIAKISEILQIYNLNIAEMEVLRQEKGSLATAIINLDEKINDNILRLLKDIPGIKNLKLLKPLI
ncbi:MAG: L-serine ammonia-lyase, iron-sulfur-dependent subunit beta [Halanaerobiales bacterium]|nr:L-serine ammonia-lyase, iron-sulfur-dependent subunit beta [Halanaerobiales bacterium]